MQYSSHILDIKTSVRSNIITQAVLEDVGHKGIMHNADLYIANQEDNTQN